MIQPEDELFQLFHRYNKLVRRGLVRPLACTGCGQPLVTRLGREDTLVLECLSCDSRKTPGEGTISTVRAVVTEHFE